jgi:uncharacterized membrane protein
MLRRVYRYLLSVFALVASMPSFGAGFRALSLPGSQLAALSADGRTAAGGLVTGASGGFRWREDAPPQTLSGAIAIRAISPSGRDVAGSSLDAGQREVATWWDADGNAHPLGGLPGADARGGVLSVAFGVTDEPRVAGTAVDRERETKAFLWSASEGLHALTSAGTSSGAGGISGDGRRIFGWSEEGVARNGALWIDGRVCCAVDAGGAANEILGANRSATRLLGIAHEGGEDETSFRWLPDAGATSIPIASAPMQGAARFTAASDDGRLLAGAIGSGAQRVAAVWTEQRGVERLDAFLAAMHIAVPPGWTLMAATAVSADGQRVGGFGLSDGRFDSFVIDLPRSTGDAAARIRPVR